MLSPAGPLPVRVFPGDMYTVIEVPGGAVVAVVDGLGHGTEAAAAARRAIEVIEQHSTESITSLVLNCHETLRMTRGVVIGVAFINSPENSMEWLGIGNVEGILIRYTTDKQRQKESMPIRGGVLGYKIPSLRSNYISLCRGDIIIMSTDGIQCRFSDEVDISDEPEAIANRILKRHARTNDDALVLAARYDSGEF